MRVPTKDYARQYRAIWPEVIAELERCLLNEDPILGDSLTAFERELSSYHQVDHAIGLGSGTDAIVLALRELGVGAGDQVLTASHTFSGVVSAIVQAGADPLLVEPDPETGLLSAAGVANARSPRAKAVLAVHLYGAPVPVDELRTLCDRDGLLLLEDAAQAHGARWRDRPVGGFGRAGLLSFHPSKNLGAFGDGGAVLTNDAELAAHLRVVRNLGKSGKYEFERVAPNSKLDTLQAAILRVKLRHLDAWVERRRVLAARYAAGLAGVGDLRLPAEPAHGRHAWHLYVVQTERRDELRAFLDREGIRTGLHYPIAAHEQPALRDRFVGRDFPLASRLARTVVSLPLSHEHEDAEIDAVVAAIRRFFGSAP